MRDAVITAAVRSPIGKRNGGLAGTHAVELSAAVLNELVRRAGVDPVVVDDVHWGNVISIGQQSGNIGRMAVLGAGWPESVPGFTVDRQCGSSQQAISTAAAAVISGQADIIVAGGVEMMSAVPMGAASVPGTGDMGGPAVARYHHVLAEAPGFNGRFNQGAGAELIASLYGLSRTQLDEYSIESHERAGSAEDDGLFLDEILTIQTGSGEVRVDEGIRRGSTIEKLAVLKTPFLDGGVITAGNASQISDGAAAVLITTSERAAELGMTPLARIHTAVVTGDDPVKMLTGPIPATALALKRSGLAIDDIEFFEVNEAFASVPLAWQAATGVNRDRVNPVGGAIALGHPLGASGARLATTLIHHLHRTGARYGLQTMCEGGGTANATIYERIG